MKFSFYEMSNTKNILSKSIPINNLFYLIFIMIALVYSDDDCLSYNDVFSFFMSHFF